jgi:hypothetical protein
MRMRLGARMLGDAGYITAEQFRNVALARFDRADANHDGTLTVAERQARRGEMRRHMRMGPPPGGPGMPPPPPEPAQSPPFWPAWLLAGSAMRSPPFFAPAFRFLTYLKSFRVRFVRQMQGFSGD